MKIVVNTKTFLVVAVVCVHSVESSLLVRGRGCQPSGAHHLAPGSPPCIKTYYGSGHPEATPKPLMPTPDPSGIKIPGCTCSEDALTPPGIPDVLGGNQTNVTYFPNETEVEVVTVSVPLANKVRCNKTKVAEDLAKALGIPLQRIEVKPWSWELPDPPQSNYLALLQQDHERCACEGQSRLGYRKVNRITHGVSIGANPAQTVMTVNQFNTMTGQLTNAVNVNSAVAGWASQDVIPASRVQMLTRDPCLVKLIRAQTPFFRQKIANLLNMPVEKVLVIPPAIQPFAFLEVNAKVHHQKKVERATMLGVHECNLVELGEMAKHMSLIGGGAKIAHASFRATNSTNTTNALNGTANGTNGTFNGTNGTNGTNSTNTTNATAQKVLLTLKLGNLSYDDLAADINLTDSFVGVQKMVVGNTSQIPPSQVYVNALYPGSVIVSMTIDPAGSSASAVASSLFMSVCTNMITGLYNMSGLPTSGLPSCTIEQLVIEDAGANQTKEQNRPWIAFWTIAVREPNAKEGAFKLLKELNHPGTALSNLLPMTLARIPGLKYRGIQEPNLAIEHANETRLPPPEDKAVGFAIADPYDTKSRLKKEEQRMAQEQAERDQEVKQRTLEETARANELLNQAALQAQQLNRTKTQITLASRLHAEVLRNEDAMAGPDIVPYDTIQEEPNESESPYPWRDQISVR